MVSLAFHIPKRSQEYPRVKLSGVRKQIPHKLELSTISCFSSYRPCHTHLQDRVFLVVSIQRCDIHRTFASLVAKELGSYRSTWQLGPLHEHPFPFLACVLVHHVHQPIVDQISLEVSIHQWMWLKRLFS